VVEIIAVWLQDAKGILGRLLTKSDYTVSHDGEGTTLVPLFKLQCSSQSRNEVSIRDTKVQVRLRMTLSQPETCHRV